VRSLAILALLAGLVHVVRDQLLRQDQRQFDQRYPTDGPIADGPARSS
jgi:hypothetical protein